MTAPFEWPVIAVVGVAKNCGKTTTLNALVARARSRGRRIGLVSAGIDGERTDALLGTPKPAVAVSEGMLVASARIALEQSSAEFEYLDDLGFSTPLGESVLVRVVSSGDVVLAGMRHGTDIAGAIDAMRTAGAEQVWVDGAYGRVAAAPPEVADAVIVATGAVVSPHVPNIVEETAAVVDRLSVPEVTEPWQRALVTRAVTENRVLLGGPGIEPIALDHRSALVALPNASDVWTEEIAGVAIPGLVSDRVLHELTHKRSGGTLVLQDGTKLQADPRAIRRFTSSWQLRVLETVRVVGISFNPNGLRGQRVDTDHLRSALASRYPKIPVFDPLVGIQ